MPKSFGCLEIHQSTTKTPTNKSSMNKIVCKKLKTNFSATNVIRTQQSVLKWFRPKQRSENLHSEVAPTNRPEDQPPEAPNPAAPTKLLEIRRSATPKPTDLTPKETAYWLRTSLRRMHSVRNHEAQLHTARL